MYTFIYRPPACHSSMKGIKIANRDCNMHISRKVAPLGTQQAQTNCYVPFPFQPEPVFLLPWYTSHWTLTLLPPSGNLQRYFRILCTQSSTFTIGLKRSKCCVVVMSTFAVERCNFKRHPATYLARNTALNAFECQGI